MDNNKTKKTETFASIFGDDYDETPLSKDEGVSTLKVGTGLSTKVCKLGFPIPV
ncbi:hypothetical protein [Fusibacter tunisiensis]|uniref:Uncharacterized protein n=1 Tax=Fusibacter tunisiensis TaxID=1008308 RepID=A0ABS2MTF1_9FIRM|nr:hypothetical protein [Fusibacter tunisiensis]MBM7562704.1 hypothetical protein [Fusibacter tunisiensis]